MRGYGLPRNQDVEFPDCGDIRLYGLKQGRFKNKQSKARTRRIWKGIERTKAKQDILKQIIELQEGNSHE
jgi:hypothetical protein